jgi:hypothetical protein
VAVSIVCYSHTGNNQVLADYLAERLQCGIARITERRPRTWLRTLRDLAFAWSPAIEPLRKPLSAYGHVILIGPVWASRLASPLRTFLSEHGEELGEYSFITLCGYARPEQKQRLTAELTRRVGHAPLAVCELPVAELLPRRQRNDVRAVTPYRIGEEDLAEYEGRIADFLAEAGIHAIGVELLASNQQSGSALVGNMRDGSAG